MDPETFLQQQCRIVESTFSGGECDLALRELVQHTLKGGAMPYESRFANTDMDDTDPFQQIDMKNVQPEFKSQLTTLQENLAQLSETMDHEQIDQLAQAERIDQQQRQEHQTLDLVTDKDWVQSGLDYFDKATTTSEKMNRLEYDHILQGDVLDPNTQLVIPPQPSYVHCVAWMERMLQFLSKRDTFQSWGDQKLRIFQAQITSYVHTFAALSMLPVSLEWLNFQMYVNDRLSTE